MGNGIVHLRTYIFINIEQQESTLLRSIMRNIFLLAEIVYLPLFRIFMRDCGSRGHLKSLFST